MALKLDLLNPRRSESSSVSGLSSAAGDALDMSRSSSSSETARRLVFRGQGVNVVLPSVIPEINGEGSEILEMVSRIHLLGKEEVVSDEGGLLNCRVYQRLARRFILLRGNRLRRKI